MAERKAKTAEIPVDKVRIDGETQSRKELCNDTIREYADAMTEGAEFPPIVVYFDGADYWLSDGFHRFHAARQVQFGTIAAEVRDGSQADAQWASYAANQTHGLKRSNADKRKAVEQAIKHPTGSELSDSAIAEHCGVSQPFVGKCRSELAATYNGYKSDARKGRDGRTTNTAKIGKKAEPVPDVAPTDDWTWDAAEPNVVNGSEPQWVEDESPVLTDDDWKDAETQDARLKAAKAPYLRSLKSLKAFHESVVAIIESDEPGNAWMDERDRNTWQVGVDKLSGQIRLVMPEVTCPRCDAKGCETCRESGFVSRRLVNRLKDAGKL